MVNTPNEANLRAAIALGQVNSGVQFNGTLTLTSSINISNNVVLDGSGFTPTISGGNAIQLFYVANGAGLTLSNLPWPTAIIRVTNSDTPAGDVGAVLVNGGTLKVVGCTLSNNVAQSLIAGALASGGAILNDGGTVTIYGSDLSSNLVTGATGSSLMTGGAIAQSSGTMDIMGTSFASNQVLGAAGVSQIFFNTVKQATRPTGARLPLPAGAFPSSVASW